MARNIRYFSAVKLNLFEMVDNYCQNLREIGFIDAIFCLFKKHSGVFGFLLYSFMEKGRVFQRVDDFEEAAMQVFIFLCENISIILV